MSVSTVPETVAHDRGRRDGDVTVVAPNLAGGEVAVMVSAALVDRHASGAADHRQVLWHLLMVEGFLAGLRAGQAAPEVAHAEALP